MSNFPSKVDIPVAVAPSTKKFYSQNHLTTQTFMTPRPIFSREYVPGRNMKVSCDSFIRCQPLPTPVFGTAKSYNRAFFVPFRAVWPCFNDFYTSTVYNFPNGTSQIPSIVPSIQNKTIVDMFRNSVGGSDPLLIVSTGPTDIVINYGGVNTGYVFTNKGVLFYTILESLGYKINWTDFDSNISSGLPLLCYSKVMIDWYYPSSYVGSTEYNTIQSYFCTPTTLGTVNSGFVLNALNAVCRCCYTPDYFVNAFDTPVAPNDASVERGISITDVTNNSIWPRVVSNSSTISPSASGIQPTNHTPFIGGTSSLGSSASSGVTTQYVIQSLRALTDYTRRHTLSGVRVLDRYLSEMGINLTAEILNRSMYLGSQEFDIDFFEVMSHADTSTMPVGGYAGKGIANSGIKEFTYDNGQEFGMFIIVNSIVPNVGYFEGEHREVSHIHCLDFYHGDFDHMAVQPISARELFVPQDGSVPAAGSTNDQLQDAIFGYTSKYVEYNTPMDLQSGLFRVKSQSGLLPFYSLMRSFNSTFSQTSPSNIKHSIGFVQGDDAGQYNRIFLASKADNENFLCHHHFEVTNIDSTLPAYDTYEFQHEDDHRHVTLDVNGSKVN